jgi:hypothetical protein
MHWAFFQQLFGSTLKRAQEQGRLLEPEVVSWLEPLVTAAQARAVLRCLDRLHCRRT